MPFNDRLQAALETLPEAHQRVATFACENRLKTAGMTVAELAEQAGVSSATINRFVRSLGYSGFTDFRADLLEDIRQVLAPEDKLISKRGKYPGKDMLEAIFANLSASLRAQLTPANAETAVALAHAFPKARAIHVCGFGSSGFVANYAAHLLEPVCRSVVLMSVAGGSEQAMRRIAQIRAGDILLVITLKRYSREIVTIADLARKRGARVVVVTDSAMAPVAFYANDLLLAPTDHPVASSSVCGAVAWIEALFGLIAMKNPGALSAMQSISEFVSPYVFDGDRTKPGDPPKD